MCEPVWYSRLGIGLVPGFGSKKPGFVSSAALPPLLLSNRDAVISCYYNFFSSTQNVRIYGCIPRK